jgi:acetate kinase
LEGSFLEAKLPGGGKFERKLPMENHTQAFRAVQQVLTSGKTKVIDSLDEVSAVGHRVVQGGPNLQKSMRVTEEVLAEISMVSELAPLHNPAHLQGIHACLEVFGEATPQVVVFDTAFHSTMPPEAYIFPIPYEYYEKYKIRRYGFHGTSHKFVSARAAEALGQPIGKLKLITCHLGNGSSITAVQHGKVIDTSMGLTPLDGIMMGTRSGALDPSVVTFIAEKEGLSPKELDEILNKKSGLLGVSGVSSDDRDISTAVSQGNDRAILAHEILRYQIKKYIGGYAAALNGVDGIVFTGGLGENQYRHRSAVCMELTYLGIEIDLALNAETIHGKGGIISTPASKVTCMVIPTNEEIVIARDTMRLIGRR